MLRGQRFRRFGRSRGGRGGFRRRFEGRRGRSFEVKDELDGRVREEEEKGEGEGEGEEGWRGSQ